MDIAWKGEDTEVQDLEFCHGTGLPSASKSGNTWLDEMWPLQAPGDPEPKPLTLGYAKTEPEGRFKETAK